MNTYSLSSSMSKKIYCLKNLLIKDPSTMSKFDITIKNYRHETFWWRYWLSRSTFRNKWVNQFLHKVVAFGIEISTESISSYGREDLCRKSTLVHTWNLIASFSSRSCLLHFCAQQLLATNNSRFASVK